MSSVIDTLEKSVGAAAMLIAELRDRVASLERELTMTSAELHSAAAQPLPSSCDPTVTEELERLRSERVLIRKLIRELLKEIDRVSR